MARTPARAALASLARAASSTSASTSKSKGGKAAKPQPRRSPAPTPAPASRPGDDFAPLFAGLVALCQAHEGASSAPARALLAALAAILDLCRRYLAAPSGSYLMEGCLDTGAGGGFAGLQLVAPAPAAPPQAAPRAPQAPVEEPPALRPLGAMHKMLGSQTLILLEYLGDLGEALDGADVEARRMMEPNSGTTIACIRVDIEAARDCLRFTTGAACELAATLTGEESGRSVASHAAALAMFDLLAGDERVGADWADWNRKKLCKAFRDDAV